MSDYIDRKQEEVLRRKLERAPVVAILGPRQCGKSTLAQHVIADRGDAVRLDLERASDRAKLQDPEAFFEVNRGKLICLDEVQRAPEIFRAIRPFVDETDAPGQFLLLGSASPELLRQSSESLAGRISFLELSPFVLSEVNERDSTDVRDLWLRGGYPRSYLARSEEDSLEWRRDFIRTFLERDLPLLAPRIPGQRMDRLWRMAAHVHGQLLNSSKLAESLGVSVPTVRAYFELLEQTFVVRLLEPLDVNLKKRLVKSPKLFIRDTGILHALLGLESANDLLGHPVYGASWEGLVIEHALCTAKDWDTGFYRTAGGAEVDLVLEKAGRRIAIECKSSTAPRLTRGFTVAVQDLEPDESWVVAPVESSFPLKKATVIPLHELIDRIECL